MTGCRCRAACAVLLAATFRLAGAAAEAPVDADACGAGRGCGQGPEPEGAGLMQLGAPQRQPQPSAAVDGDAACFSGLQTVAEYRACLASVPIDPGRRDCALEVVFSQLRSLYTYSDLLRNSSDHDAESLRDFDVYNITLGHYLEELLPKLKEETSAGLLTLELSRLFVKFQDAHTALYSNPLVRAKLLPPVAVEVDTDEAGNMQFTVAEAQDWVPVGLEGKVLSTINGKATLDYFLEVAARAAIDKSRGAQLNRYLKRQRLSGMGLPDDGGVFNAVFKDGTTAELAWMVQVPETACGLGADYKICGRAAVAAGDCPRQAEIMAECFTHNPDFDDMVVMMEKIGYKHLTCSPGGVPAGAAVGARSGRAAGLPSGAAAGLGKPLAGSPGESPAEELPLEEPAKEEEQRRDARRSEVVVPIERVAFVEDSCDVLRVGLQDGSSATVLKIMGFGPFSEIYPCARAAAEWAANVSAGKLIIDVIGNGGGYVSSGYELNSFLYSLVPGSGMRETFQACEWYDLPHNAELDWFVSLAKQGLPHVANAASPAGFIAALADRMDKAVVALGVSPDQFGRNDKSKHLQESASCLRVLLSKFEAPPPAVGANATTAVWLQYDSLYKQCVELAEPLGGAAGMGIMSYSPSNKHPAEMSPPTWDYYTSTVTKRRGGVNRRFSSMTFLGDGCAGYQAAYPEMYGKKKLEKDGWPYRPQTTLTQITYLSDGNCGSTCSVSSSTPYLNGLATFVTFGGVKGEPMDITSFNGGNVGTYQAQHGWSIWKEALDSVVDVSVFHPSETPPSWPFLPIPLNLYKARFAQRAEYPRALGKLALPREWYLIPASYHLDIWTTDSLQEWSGLEPAAQRTLHRLYAATAGKAPKPLV